MSTADTQAPTLPIHEIQSLVAKRFGVPVVMLLSDSRSPVYVLPRQVAMYLAAELTGYSEVRIGNAFRRDRTTVRFARGTVAAKCRGDRDLAMTVTALRAELSERMPVERMSNEIAARNLVAAASVAVEGGNQAIFDRLAAAAAIDPGRVVQELDHMARRLEREIGR